MSLPFWVKPLALLLLVAGLITGYYWWRHRVAAEAVQMEQARVEHIAEQQRQANRSRSRDAETRYSTQTVIRERFITQTIMEVRHATDSLAACPVPEPAIRLLNRAAECARENRPASCGAGDSVR
jgi:hypothetical protein